MIPGISMGPGAAKGEAAYAGKFTSENKKAPKQKQPRRSVSPVLRLLLVADGWL